MRGQSGACLREVCGDGPPALLARKGPGVGARRPADRDTSDCSSGSWQVLLVHRAYRRLTGFFLPVTRRAAPLRGDAFSPNGAAAQASPSPLFLRVGEEEMTSQAGPG